MLVVLKYGLNQIGFVEWEDGRMPITDYLVRNENFTPMKNA